MNPSVRQFGIVLALWTVVGLCGGLADYAWALALGRPGSLVQAMARPLVEHWIWAALTPIVFHLAGRFRLDRPDWPRMLGIHAVCFVLLSLAHCVIAEVLGEQLVAVPPGYQGSRLLLRFLEEFYSDIWMYWPLVCIRALLDSQGREREREREAARLRELVAQSQLSMLRAQIQPHFLFNTLHAITTLLRVDPRAAEDMVADLSEILRASFSGATAQEVPLRQELALTACYLRIQQRRLGPRLRVEIRVDPDAADAAVPALVLQSLVENAVVHGIVPLRRSGTVQIEARRDADQLLLTVRDDGVGLPADEASRAGIGLANARERLARLYGAEQTLGLISTPDRGTSVRMCLPYHCCSTDPASGATHHEDSHLDRGRRAARPAEPVDLAGAGA